MTLEEIKASGAPFLNAADIADVVGADSQAIRYAAHRYPEKLGFPVSVIGKRTRIPRKAFLRWLGEETNGA